MKSKTVLFCVGTRPEIIKMAPVYHALQKMAGIKPVLLHSGQHATLTDNIYEFFDMTPDYRFQLTRQSQTLGHLFALIMDHLDNLFSEIKPDAVLVQGDTSTALASALTAFYHQCKVGHVEAGLRSFSEYEPFPEEKNREIISRLAHWHFVPTTRATQNLLQENISDKNIYKVGNTIVDAVNWTKKHLQESGLHAPETLTPVINWIKEFSENKRLVLVTAHRRESWDGQISNIARAIQDAAKRFPDIHFVWPVHPNPVVKAAVHETLQKLDSGIHKQIYLTDPIDYPVLIWILQQAWLVMTDSGGIQEEAISLQVPVLVLRDKTERPEVVEAHGGLLIGTQRDTILKHIEDFHDKPDYYASFKCSSNPFAEGHSAERITEILAEQLLNQ